MKMIQEISYETLKAKFLKSLMNVPEILREDILVVVEEKPFSWNTAAFEVKNNTTTGKKILKILKELQII